MNRYFSKIKIIFIVMAFISLLHASESGYIIANKDVQVNKLSKQELSSIFLGNKQFWDNGSRIKTSYIMDKSEFSFIFFNQYVEKAYKKFKRYWLKKIFSGYGAAPKNFKNPEQIIDFVSRNSGAIGFYIGEKPNNKQNLKIIKINGSEIVK